MSNREVLAARRMECETNSLYFSRYFFKQQFGRKLIVAPHVKVIRSTLDRTLLPVGHPDRISRLIINIPPGYGKCSVEGTRVVTDHGLTTVENLNVGDKVQGFDKGSSVFRRVLGKETYEKHCVEIKTLSGRTLTVSHDHPVLTQNGWIKARDLTSNHYLIKHRDVSEFNVKSNMKDFIYDKVKTTNPVGYKNVVHIEVEADNYDNKNYLANGLVVHNTDIATIYNIAHGLAINPQARFLHLSYSADLALGNSTKARSIVTSKEFQQMWKLNIMPDTNSKSTWHTNQHGGVRASSSQGQVTGFRAGHMYDGEQSGLYSGSLIIDDPVKPADAYSEILREGVNETYNETISSRLALEDVPVIVIMQRIHYRDLSGYLLRGGSGEKWHHLNLPVYIDNSIPYNPKNTHGIPIEHGLPDGWLWPLKHNDEHKAALMSHRRKYRAQYMQDPIERDEETALWNESMMNKAHQSMWDYEPRRVIVSVDPAVSNNDTSDEHGIVVAGDYGQNRYAVLDDGTMRGSPLEWANKAIFLYNRHKADAIVIETNQGGDMCEGTLRNAGFTGRVIRVHASKGKTARAEPIAALYELGYVRHEADLVEMEDEMLDFDPITGKSNGRSPNRVDAVVWALTELSGGVDLAGLLSMAMGTR